MSARVPGFPSMKFGLNGSSQVIDRPNHQPAARARFPAWPARPKPAETRVGEDDSARFARVVLPYLGDAFGLARWLTGNRADAEDVVQEACLHAFRAIDQFGDGNARAWVLTIVRNTAYSWLAKNRPAAVLITDDLELLDRAEPGDAGIETPETALIAKADAERLEAAIGELPPPFRETLVLRDLQGLDYREIAKVTGVPIGTVMSRLARARDRLIAIVAKDAT